VNVTAPAFTFRLWQGNFFRNIIKAVDQTATGKKWVKGERVEGGRQEGAGYLVRLVAPMFALGGMTAFGNQLMNTAQVAGYDPKKRIKEWLPDGIEDAVINGIPSIYGLDLANSIGLGNVVPDKGSDIPGAVGRLALGVGADIPDKIAKSRKYYQTGDSWRAIETLLPESAKNLSKAYRYSEKGAQGPVGEQLLAPKEFTGTDLALASGGFPLSKVNRAQEAYHSATVAANKGKDPYVNLRLAKAMLEGGDALKSEMAKIAAHNKTVTNPAEMLTPDVDAILSQVEKLKNPWYAKVKGARLQNKPLVMEAIKNR
jgi:hypothetical protein